MPVFTSQNQPLLQIVWRVSSSNAGKVFPPNERKPLHFFIISFIFYIRTQSAPNLHQTFGGLLPNLRRLRKFPRHVPCSEQSIDRLQPLVSIHLEPCQRLNVLLLECKGCNF